MTESPTRSPHCTASIPVFALGFALGFAPGFTSAMDGTVLEEAAVVGKGWGPGFCDIISNSLLAAGIPTKSDVILPWRSLYIHPILANKENHPPHT